MRLNCARVELGVCFAPFFHDISCHVSRVEVCNEVPVGGLSGVHE